jgi:hypothetical protein
LYSHVVAEIVMAGARLTAWLFDAKTRTYDVQLSGRQPK